ncbi:hypothetical protein PPMP20_29805 [Paraburkholderia phymatum]|uniref:hypothetical protein n=1 Tax=Paraburkholderia phymatum TaxID=148447 RepID=UPI00030C867B|nr:hypothetical protein [Paraburkholderia phymatum]
METGHTSQATATEQAVINVVLHDVGQAIERARATLSDLQPSAAHDVALWRLEAARDILLSRKEANV